MYRLAMFSKPFAVEAVEQFIDMFNDENEEVRLNALSKLRRLNRKWTFSISDSLIDSMILSLQDQDFRVRNLAYSLVSDLHFKSLVKLDQMVDLMVQMMIRKGHYDQRSIQIALMNLGIRHHEVIGKLSIDLGKRLPFYLGEQQTYLTQEFRLDDHRHNAHLLLVFGAASRSPSILARVSPSILDRYTYLKAKYPHAVPTLHTPDNTEIRIPGPQKKPNEIGFMLRFQKLLQTEHYLQNRQVLRCILRCLIINLGTWVSLIITH
jgi:hypothetical protein